jgi:glycosyltransferase involved in cell wall biosynthesis
MHRQSDKIKVLHIITRFDKGGSAENTFLTVRDLDKDRYEVILVKGASIAGNVAEPEIQAAEANVFAAGARGVRVISLHHLVRDLRPVSDVIAFFMLVRIIRRERPRIVHTHTSKAGILGRWAAWLCNVPIIVHTPHGHVFWGYFKPMQTRLFVLLERWTARITTAIVVLTPQEKEDHLRFSIAPEAKFTVIHSGVDFGSLLATVLSGSLSRKSLNLPDGAFVVGTVGRLTPVKGHIHLLRAALKLLAGRADIYFLLVGEGELREELLKYCQDVGIAENVKFLGWRADVGSVLSVLDVFVLPSLNEGMGKAVVEAMALAKPVIASDVGGIPDMVIPGESGILVPPADSDALADAILVLYGNQKARKALGDQGKVRAEEYGVDAMVRKLMTLYVRLMGFHRAPNTPHDLLN